MISITIDGLVLIIILAAYGGYLGHKRGIRDFLTITLFSSLAYLWLVGGGERIVDYLTRLYENLPKLLALLLGNDPGSVGKLPPITIDLSFPPLVGAFLFLIIVILSWVFNKNFPWYSSVPTEPLARPLGMVSGMVLTLIWISALTTFWRRLAGEVTTPGTLNDVLRGLPDITMVVPWLIAIFFAAVLVTTATVNLPKLWSSPMKK